jgi:hypothetical protein
MRSLFLFILHCLYLSSNANKGSAWHPGTMGPTVVSSRQLDILHEQINITIDNAFRYAQFDIEYIIKSDSTGLQIPLLFYAASFNSDFRVMLDGREVELQSVPDVYIAPDDPVFGNFLHAFENANSHVKNEKYEPAIWIRWAEHDYDYCRLADLHYFQVNLSKGQHTISVRYTAEYSRRAAGRLHQYSFMYSLSPAQHWRSFGSLEINVNSTAFDQPIENTLGPPTSGNIDSVASWKFDALPAEHFSITYTPQISGLAKALVYIGPGILTAFVVVVLIIIHVYLMVRYRNRNPEARFTAVRLIGSLLNPVLFFVAYAQVNELIDAAIGPEAARGWNDMGLIMAWFILLPIVFLFYVFIMWVVDTSYKDVLKKKLIQPSKKN